MQGGFPVLHEPEPEPECVGRSCCGWAQRVGCVSRFEAVLSRVGAHYVHQCAFGGPASVLFGPSLNLGKLMGKRERREGQKWKKEKLVVREILVVREGHPAVVIFKDSKCFSIKR